MIFPVPLEEKYGEEKYTLKTVYQSENLYDFYTCAKNGSDDIKYNKNVMLGEEEYKINIGADGVCIEYSTEQGKFRALTSLRQIFLNSGENVPYAKVYDKPQFKHRAYMQDISRNRIPKKETIFEVIDYIAALKYNEFQLYMENFCFEYSEFPQFTENFDCLSVADIKDIEKYCKERFIELIPCQNGFGHMTTWLATDEYKHLALTDGTLEAPDTINPLLDESFELMDKIYKSLLPHFESETVNVCFDEAMALGKYQIEEVCKKYGNDTVFMDWFEKIVKLVTEKYGMKRVLFWDDMIINYPDSFKRIPENAVALEWGYDYTQSQIMEARCMALKEKNIPFYVCPSTHSCLSFTGRFDESSFNVRTAGEVGRKHGAIGYMMTDWGDGGHPQFMVWSYLPIALAAQYTWNVGVEQNGGQLKPEYITAAENYVDLNIFNGAKVAKRLKQIANYFLLEPYRIHGQSVSNMALRMELTQRSNFFFDFEEVGDAFEFENVINYLKYLIERIARIEFDDIYKRQIILNARMAILGAEYAIIKVNNCVSRGKVLEITELTDYIKKELYELWMMKNYEQGIEEFMGYLNSRLNELKIFAK